MKTSVSSAAHRRPRPPGFCRIRSTGARPLVTAAMTGMVALRAPTSATITDHGAGSGLASGRRRGHFAAGTEGPWRSTGGRHGPDLNLGLDGVFRRIRRRIALAIRSVITAAHVDDALAIVRKRDLRQLLPIVVAICGDAPSLE